MANATVCAKTAWRPNRVLHRSRVPLAPGRTVSTSRASEPEPKKRRRLPEGSTPPVEEANDEGGYYFSADRAVSTDSLTMKVAPHHLEPGPPGLIGVLETPVAV